MEIPTMQTQKTFTLAPYDPVLRFEFHGTERLSLITRLALDNPALNMRIEAFLRQDPADNRIDVFDAVSDALIATILAKPKGV
jgi:hypothetical protein